MGKEAQLALRHASNVESPDTGQKIVHPHMNYALSAESQDTGQLNVHLQPQCHMPHGAQEATPMIQLIGSV